jgi:predicted Zn-dependent protease
MRAPGERRWRGRMRASGRPHGAASCALAAVVLLAVALGAAAVGLAGVASPMTDAERAEAERAAASAARIERDWPLAGPGPFTRFVRKLGARLGERARPTPFPWRFTVVRDRSANAFAIGGGRIYVNEGVVTLCETEAELAAILAHEMAHQLAGHFRGAAKRGEESARIELGGVVQEVDPAKEREADRIALEILRKAGYDPHSALSLAVRQQGQPAGVASHLRDDRRIESLRAELEGVPNAGRRDSAAYGEVRRQVLEKIG